MKIVTVKGSPKLRPDQYVNAWIGGVHRPIRAGEEVEVDLDTMEGTLDHAIERGDLLIVSGEAKKPGKG